MLHRLDRYIIGKFLSSFFFVSLIFLLIASVIDLTEKLSDFIDKSVPVLEIVIYYGTFIPHMFSLLAPLFLFIGVIFFTSKLAADEEIVAVLGNGISYYRLLRPYLITGVLIAVFLLGLNHFLVPTLNKKRVSFLNTYIHHMANNESGINLSIDKGADYEIIVSMQNFSFTSNEGFQLSYEHYQSGELQYHLRAPRIRWKEDRQFWEIPNYEEWVMKGDRLAYEQGVSKDTTLGFTPDEFVRRLELKEMMPFPELKRFIHQLNERGLQQAVFFELEMYNRTSNAFAVIILTFIGVAFSSRKKRGGTGVNIAIGFGLSALFVLFLRFSTTFATNADLHPAIAVWIPNLIFGVLAVIMVRVAPK